MKIKELENYMKKSLKRHFGDVLKVETFGEYGLLTEQKGVILHMSDGTEIHLSIKELCPLQ